MNLSEYRKYEITDAQWSRIEPWALSLWYGINAQMELWKSNQPLYQSIWRNTMYQSICKSICIELPYILSTADKSKKATFDHVYSPGPHSDIIVEYSDEFLSGEFNRDHIFVAWFHFMCHGIKVSDKINTQLRGMNGKILQKDKYNQVLTENPDWTFIEKFENGGMDIHDNDPIFYTETYTEYESRSINT